MFIDPTQAEQTICATVIAKPELLDDMELSHEDFLDAEFGLVYRTARFLRETDKPVNTFAVIEKLAKRVSMEKLTVACDTTQSQPWSVADAIRLVRSEASRRRVIATAQKMMEIAQTSADMDESTLSEIQRSFDEVAKTMEQEKGPEHIADLLPQYMEEFEERRKNSGSLRGAETGFLILDGWLHGWLPTYFVVIGARPSVGKTAFMLQSAYESSEKNCVVMFSIEMYRELLIDRMFARSSYVKLDEIIDGTVSDEQYIQMIRASDAMQRRTLYIDDNSDITVPYMRSRLRRIARRHSDKKLVVYVDYLQIVRTAEKMRSTVDEIASIARGLKSLAKELKCTVIALAQLTREVDKRGTEPKKKGDEPVKDKGKPTLGDLKGSSQIEQEADVIMFLYRNDYYTQSSSPDGQAKISVSKNRNGKLGVATFQFKKEYQKFIPTTNRDDEP